MTERPAGDDTYIPDKVLFQDFYETFRFSQGTRNSQLFLFGALASVYKEQGWVAPNLIQRRYLQKVETLRTPANHVAQSVSDQCSGFLLQWCVFSDVLTGRYEIVDFDGLSPYDRLAYDLLGSDLSFADDPERIRYGQDPGSLKSYYREYVMLQTPLASVRFNGIVKNIHTAAEQSATNPLPHSYLDRLGRLAVAWQSRGEGEFTAGTCEPVARMCDQALIMVQS